MISGIYKIVNTKNGKMYIGSSIDLDRRRVEHLRSLRKNVHHSGHLQNAYNQDPECLIFEIIDIISLLDCATLTEKRNLLEGREQHYMDKFKAYDDQCGYNIRKDAHSSVDCWNEDNKRSQSERMMGNQNGLGHPCSTEKAEKIAAAQRGKPKNPESIKKMAESLSGRKQSPEHIEKCRLSRIGHAVSQETRDKIAAAQKGRDNTKAIEASANARRGKSLSDEHKAKCSKSLTGRTPTLETRAKLSADNKGRQPSALARQRSSELRKGKKMSEEQKSKISEGTKLWWESRRGLCP